MVPSLILAVISCEKQEPSNAVLSDFEAAKELVLQGEYTTALAELKQILLSRNRSNSIYEGRTMQWDQLEIYIRILEDVGKDKANEEALRHIVLGLRYFEHPLIRKYDDSNHSYSLSEYDQAISLDSSYVFGYWIRGYEHIYAKHYKKGISDLSRWLQQNPNDAITYVDRGDAYINLGLYL